MYRNRFSKVWLWAEWPKYDGHDTGIDLVAQERDGSLCAIQCKCYRDDGNLDEKGVSNFIAKAASLKIKNKILVYTGDTITAHAEKILRDSRCQIIKQDHLIASRIDWTKYPKMAPKAPHALRPHQERALKDVIQGFQTHDRGKMIMACGTGKTLTSLHIAERISGKGKTILYLVPSISLILQSMREWSDNANIKHNYLAVCSDKSTGEDGSITELESPVSTDYRALAESLKARPAGAMTVIFCTYHSIDVVRHALKKEKLDLILCDEAHRTTGVEDKSFFTKVHKDTDISGKRRLYMTATPRVYSDVIQARLGRIIYSMDDEKKFGPDFHKLSFTEAVRMGILTDFRVKIAVVPADVVDKEFQQSVAGKGKEMPLDERTLLAAVWHGLKYPDDDKTPKLLQRVIAFANRIDRSMMFAGEIKDTEDIDRSFEGVVTKYEKKGKARRKVDVRHIDGKTRALSRRDHMRWLDASIEDPNTCRILSNARCLAEGVDVPALDAVVFLNPRKSKVDVVQSVGRVMRKSEGKNYGYVILPVAIPAGMEYHEALNDNKTFKVVWQVLNALRSHDENFANEINRLILDRNTERTSPTERVSVSVLQNDLEEPEIITKFFDKIKSKLVEKVGDINYYDKYGEKIGSAARTIEARIRNRIKSDKTAEEEIRKFHIGLREMINESVTLDATIQAIAQHKVLSRVFDELFSGEFTSHNPISIAFNTVIKKIGLDEELRDLEAFYKDVENEVKGIDTDEARQAFIKKIYGNFFESADKKGTEQHGIVYTPVEVIDFIINSIQHILKTEFDTEFNDRNVKVLEPFAGTGTFLVRLLESGFITTNLYEKYRRDLYANELILLAYYIATVNIETAYSRLRRSGKYVPFDGISYTDTLRINPQYRDDERHRKKGATLAGEFEVAHKRLRNQRWQHLHVLLGNPPYSAGQSDYNDDTPNLNYPELDDRIKNSYVDKVKKINSDIQQIRSLYDSYIRSIRWASDRIGRSGIIGFITNGSFIRSEAAAGIRASLQDEFTDIWCFDLRGNQRTQGEISKREGGKIFGSGSRAPVSITILVKNPDKKNCTIHYKNIGDYLTRDQKLEMIKNSKSIIEIKDWQIIIPDKHYDWVNERRDEFTNYVPIGSKDVKSNKSSNAIFKMYSSGVKTHRDEWMYNSSKKELSQNMKRHIDYCNSQDLNKPNIDPKQAKWTAELSDKLKRKKANFDKDKIRIALYRPFFKQYLYLDGTFVERPGRILDVFPERHSKNLIIIIPYKSISIFSTFVTNVIPDLSVVPADQCFSLYIYDDKMKKKPNITDYILHEYQNHYNNKKITPEHIFEYVYGILHHIQYRKKFVNNLAREMPHIPMAPDFWAFRNIGKELIDLHLNYETGTKYDLGKPKFTPKKFTKLVFGRKTVNGKRGKDTSVICEGKVPIFDNLPEIEYQVGGRTPMEWLVDRYNHSVDRESGIVNDPLDTMTGKEVIDLIRRFVHVGVQSDKLVKSLPAEFEPKDWKPKKTGLDAFSDSKSAQTKL